MALQLGLADVKLDVSNSGPRKRHASDSRGANASSSAVIEELQHKVATLEEHVKNLSALTLANSQQIRKLRATLWSAQFDINSMVIKAMQGQYEAFVKRAKQLREEGKSPSEVDDILGSLSAHNFNGLLQALMEGTKGSPESQSTCEKFLSSLKEKGGDRILPMLGEMIPLCEVEGHFDKSTKKLVICLACDETKHFFHDQIEPFLRTQRGFRKYMGKGPAGAYEKKIQLWLDKKNGQVQDDL